MSKVHSEKGAAFASNCPECRKVIWIDELAIHVDDLPDETEHPTATCCSNCGAFLGVDLKSKLFYKLTDEQVMAYPDEFRNMLVRMYKFNKAMASAKTQGDVTDALETVMRSMTPQERIEFITSYQRSFNNPPRSK